MANEVTIRSKLAFLKAGDWARFDFGELSVTMTGSKWKSGRITVTTADEAIPLGEVAAGNAWIAVRNWDATNKLIIKGAAAGFAFWEILAGEIQGPIRFGSGVVTPVALAGAATVDFSYLLVSA